MLFNINFYEMLFNINLYETMSG